MRSINTSLAAVLPVMSLLVVGVVDPGRGRAARTSPLALLVGLLAGSYSSIFIATPILALLKGKDKRTRSRRRQRAATPAPAARSAASTGCGAPAGPDTAGDEDERAGVPAGQPARAGHTDRGQARLADPRPPAAARSAGASRLTRPVSGSAGPGRYPAGRWRPTRAGSRTTSGTSRTTPARASPSSDITPLLGDPDAFRFAVDAIADRFSGVDIDTVVGIEARGFILAAPVAYRLGRRRSSPCARPASCRGQVAREEYVLEYGTRQARDPPRRGAARRAGADRRRRPGHRRHGQRRRAAGRGPGRQRSSASAS